MMHAVRSLETSRLRLRQPAASDLTDYAALCADAAVMRYVGERGPLSREDAWRQLAMLVGLGHSAGMACGWLRSSEAARSSVEWAFTIPRAGRNPRLRGRSLVLTGDGVTPWRLQRRLCGSPSRRSAGRERSASSRR